MGSERPDAGNALSRLQPEHIQLGCNDRHIFCCKHARGKGRRGQAYVRLGRGQQNGLPPLRQRCIVVHGRQGHGRLLRLRPQREHARPQLLRTGGVAGDALQQHRRRLPRILFRNDGRQRGPCLRARWLQRWLLPRKLGMGRHKQRLFPRVGARPRNTRHRRRLLGIQLRPECCRQLKAGRAGLGGHADDVLHRRLRHKARKGYAARPRDIHRRDNHRRVPHAPALPHPLSDIQQAQEKAYKTLGS